MVLRTDDRQWTIYDPDTVLAALAAFDAAALVMYGTWLQKKAQQLPRSLADNVGTCGTILRKIGVARQQINAGLAPNDVPDQVVHSQRLLNGLAMWLENPGSIPQETVVSAMDELAAALAYLDNRTAETGTNHPRWNSLAVAGTVCESCGRGA